MDQRSKSEIWNTENVGRKDTQYLVDVRKDFWKELRFDKKLRPTTDKVIFIKWSIFCASRELSPGLKGSPQNWRKSFPAIHLTEDYNTEYKKTQKTKNKNTWHIQTTGLRPQYKFLKRKRQCLK